MPYEEKVYDSKSGMSEKSEMWDEDKDRLKVRQPTSTIPYGSNYFPYHDGGGRNADVWPQDNNITAHHEHSFKHGCSKNYLTGIRVLLRSPQFINTWVIQVAALWFCE